MLVKFIPPRRVEIEERGQRMSNNRTDDATSTTATTTATATTDACNWTKTDDFGRK
jgi:hypothetical protein